MGYTNTALKKKVEFLNVRFIYGLYGIYLYIYGLYSVYIPILKSHIQFWPTLQKRLSAGAQVDWSNSGFGFLPAISLL
jgi:hypothetical protein